MFAKIIKRQWKRSTIWAFISRIEQYFVGRRCYSPLCSGRMELIELVARHGIFERWRCKVCQSIVGDLY